MADLIIKFTDDAAVCKFLRFCVVDAAIIREIEMEPPNEFDVEFIEKRKFDCPICKAVVSGIKALVKSDYSQDKIKHALTKVCSKLHKFGSKCQHFVDAYAGKFVELLTNAATRGKVCKLLKLCPAIDSSVLADEEEVSVNDVETGFVEVDMEGVLNFQFSNVEIVDKKKFDCPICKAVVSAIKALVKSDYSQDKIKHALTKVCSKLHKFGSKCQHFVDAYAGKFVELLTNAATRGKVCKILKLCPAVNSSVSADQEDISVNDVEVDMEHVPQIIQAQTLNFEVADENLIPEPNNVKIGECLLCRGIVKAVKEIVKHSFTKDQVKRALSKACSKVHSNHCQSFVNKHFNQLVGLISNGSKRGKVCKLIMVCSADPFAEVHLENSPQNEQSLVADDEIVISESDSVEIGSVETDMENVPQITRGQLIDFQFSNFETVEKKKFDCPICKAVVSAIKALVKSDYSQDKIKHALTKVCSKLHKFGSKCQHFVDAYAGKFVELLTNAATRGKVCKILKLCPAVDSSVSADEEDISVNDLEVDLEHVPQIIQARTLDSEVAENENIIPEPNNVKIGECLLCRGIVKAVKEIVKHSFTKDQVKRALSKACSKVHSNHCQSFVNKHFNQLVDLISNGSKRGKVCKLIMVCSADPFAEIHLENSPQNEQSLVADDEIVISESDSVEIGSVETDMENVPQITRGQLIDFQFSNFETVEKKKFDCPICKAVVSAIKALVKSDYSQDKIKHALTKVCSKLHKFGSKCQHFVDAFAGKFVELLTNAATRGKVCKILKLCPAVDSSVSADEEDISVNNVEVDMEHIPQIILAQTLNSEVADDENIIPEPNNVKIGECLLCRGIVKAVKEIVKHSFTKDQVKRALSKACSKVHSNHCQSFVNKHFNQLVDLISNGSKRGKVCKLIMVCSADPFAEVHLENSPQNEQSLVADDEIPISEPESVEIDSVEADMENVPQITRERLVGFEFSNFEAVDKKKFDCPICKAVVSAIKALVKSDYSQDKIKHALTKVCSKLHKFGSKCQHFVDAYAGKFVELLTNAATRGKVCKILKLCPAVDSSVSADEEDISVNDVEVDMEHIPQIMQAQTLNFEVADENIIPEPNNVKIGECLLCRGIVKAVKEIVKHSFTKDQVKRALSKACSKVHSNHCQSFVNKHFNQLVDLISNGSKRGKVCKLIMVCSADPFAEVHLEKSPQNEPSLVADDEIVISESDSVEIGSVETDMENVPQITRGQLIDFEFSNFETVEKKKFDCPICKAVVSAIKALVKSDYSQDKIKHALTKVCSKLHKFGSKCQHFVDAYAGKFVELLTNAATRGKVCKILKLCPAVDSSVSADQEDISVNDVEVDMEHVPQIIQAQTPNFEVADENIIPEPNNFKIGECLLCRGIVKAVKEIVKHSFTKDQVKRALSKACSKVHSNHCQSFVNKHFNQLVDLISNGSKRGKVCKLIMVCSADPFAEVHLENSPQNEQSLVADDEIPISEPESVEIDSVEADMENVPQITREQLVDFEFSNFEAVDKKKFDCPICKAVVSTIKALVKSDYSQDKIKHALTKVCSKLHKFGSKCQHFVDAYAGKFVELLTNAATRGKVCKILKLCPAVDSSVSADEEDISVNNVEVDMEHVPQIILAQTLNSEVADDENIIPEPNNVKIGECLLCRGIVKAVKEIVKHSFTKDQVKRALSKACSKVHSNHCQSFVNKHFNQLVDLISNGSKRGKVCKLIMVCSTDSFAEVELENSPQNEQEFVHFYDSELSKVETVNKKKFDCPICKVVITAIKALVKSDYSQDKINHALSKVCSKLHKLGSKCQHFVDAYSGKLIGLLAKAATRNNVCRLIKLCSTHDIFSEGEFSTMKNDECFICQTAVFSVVQIIKKDFTKDKVRHVLSALKEMCEVHKKEDPSCPIFLNLLHKHFDKLVDLIANDKTRLKSCTILKLCNSEDTYNNFLYFDLPQIFIDNLWAQNYGIKKADECSICQKIVHHILEEVRRDVTQKNIQHVINAFEHMCKADKTIWIYCPTLLKIVEKGSDKFASLIANKKTRNKVCVILKLCVSEDIEGPNFLQKSTLEKSSCIKLTKLCHICKDIVSSVIEETQNDPTNKLKIEAALKIIQNLCEIRTKNLACPIYLNLLENYFDKFVVLIPDIKTRNKTCNILKLCSIDKTPNLLEPPNMSENFEKSLSTKKDKVCNVCEIIVFTVIKLTKHDPTNKAKIEDALEIFQNWCQIRSEDPACATYLNILDKYFDKFVILIQDVKTQRKTCNILKLCPDNQIAEHPYPLELKAIDDVQFGECLICKAVVKIVEEVVKHSRTREHIKSALEKACHKIHFRHCERFVQKHLNQLLELILKATRTDKICRLIKICSIRPPEDDNLPELESIIPENNANLMEQNNQLVKQSFEQDLGDYQISLCQSCQFAVSIIKTFAENPHIEALVHEQLTKLCDLVLVSPQLRNICHNQINVHWTSLLNLIRTLQENPICHTVKLCNTPHEEVEEYDVAKVGTRMCDLCQMSLSLMKSLALNNHFAALIHDTLNNSCNLLVSPYMISMCHSEIRTHWLTWLGILRHFQEARVCQTIKMCPAMQIYGDKAKGDHCKSCKALSHLVKSILKMPNFNTRIHVVVNEMCDKLSPVYRNICHAEIDVNWQKWMTLIQATSDEKLCHKIDMCP